MRNYSIKNTKWLNKGHELDYIAALIMRPDNEVYLVGSANEMRAFYERIGTELLSRGQIKGAVDTESGERIEGVDIPIVYDSDIPRSINTIIVCTAFERKKYESTRQLFQGYGFEENRQFFQGEIYAIIYEVYVLDRICLDRVEIFLTSHCPLRCEKCIAYIPYFKEYSHTPIDKLKSDADCLLNKVDYINKYKVLGGDGLVYPDLVEYIDYVCVKYGHKIGSVRIGTNGTIIPSESVLDICMKYDVIMDVSDYKCTIGERSKLDQIIETCNKAGVKVDIKRTGEQWLDMGFPNRLPGEKDEDGLKNHYYMCSMFCRDFDDGKLFHCCTNFAAVKAGLYPLNSNDYFDFRKEFSKKELMEYEIGFCDIGHTSFCKVCRGCSDEVNPFHTEVAKQLIERTESDGTKEWRAKNGIH